MDYSVKIFLLLLYFIPHILGQSYEDQRCICVCPSVAAVLNNTATTDRRPYIANVPPHLCNCDEVILPHVGREIEGREQEFCPRCDCKYESRNTTVIKVVVIIVLWMLTLLVIYMGFIFCLDPLFIKRKKKVIYQAANRDEAEDLLSNEVFTED